MTMTDSTEPDPDTSVISVSTSDVESAGVAAAPPQISASGQNSDPAASASDASSMPDAVNPDTGEAQVWQDRYSFGNFMDRFLVGFLLIGLSLFFVYKASEQAHRYYRPLAILSGMVASLFWLWLVLRIFQARLSHHYHLTTRRLFVTSGILRRHEIMMELNHIKEVSVQQPKLFDRLCGVGTVAVASNIQGAPTLILLGVNQPHKVSDLIYSQARG